MLTVIMECRNQEAALAHTLAGLVPAAVDGLVSDVAVLDHGSTDGSARVADAAGCRFHTAWEMTEILAGARGDWLLLLEPGCRLQSGWIAEASDHIASDTRPARFAPSRHHRRPLFQRIWGIYQPLECGLLMPKRQAIAAARPGMDLPSVAGLAKPLTLRSEIVPARVAASLG